MKHFLTLLFLCLITSIQAQTKQTSIWLNTDNGAYNIDATVVVTKGLVEITSNRGANLLSLIKKDTSYYRVGHPKEIWIMRWKERTLFLTRSNGEGKKEFVVQKFKSIEHK